MRILSRAHRAQAGDEINLVVCENKESIQSNFLAKSAPLPTSVSATEAATFSLLVLSLRFTTRLLIPHPRSSQNETQSVMSSSASSTPDISSLSLSSKPSQQRIHDSYDYEGNGGNGGARSQYHYSTSPPIPAQSQYNPLTLNQSPLKNKTMRGGLPSVRFFLFTLPLSNTGLTEPQSNGWTTPSSLPITGRSPLTTTPTFLLLEAPRRHRRSMRLPLQFKETTTRSSPRLSSSRIFPSMSKGRPCWTSSSVHYFFFLFIPHPSDLGCRLPCRSQPLTRSIIISTNPANSVVSRSPTSGPRAMPTRWWQP